MCSQVDVHPHGFDSVDGDIVSGGPPPQLVDDVMKLAEIRVGAVNINSSGVVVDVFPAVACVSQVVIDEDEEAEGLHPRSL